MCGIAGIYLRNPADLGWADPNATLTKVAAELLKGIEHRGRHATGMLAVGVDQSDDPYLLLQKAACSATDFVKEAKALPDGVVRHVLLHTRFATQGHQGWPENNHPVYSGGVYVVHNGHVSNDDTLFRESGADRLGRVDSEALPMILAAQDAWTPESVVKAMEKIDGGFALAAVRPESDTMYLIRGNDSPLEVMVYRDLIVFASTVGAIERAHKACFAGDFDTKLVREVAEGEILELTPDGISDHEFSPIKRVYASRPVSYAPGWTNGNSARTEPNRYSPSNGYRGATPHHEWSGEDWDAWCDWITTTDNGKKHFDKLDVTKDGLRCSSWIIGGKPGYGLRQWTFWIDSSVTPKPQLIPAERLTKIAEGVKRHALRRASDLRSIEARVKADNARAAATTSAKESSFRSNRQLKIKGVSKRGHRLLRTTLGGITANTMNEMTDATLGFLLATLTDHDREAFLAWDGWDDWMNPSSSATSDVQTVEDDDVVEVEVACSACLELIDLAHEDLYMIGEQEVCEACHDWHKHLTSNSNDNVIPLRERLHL